MDKLTMYDFRDACHRASLLAIEYDAFTHGAISVLRSLSARRGMRIAALRNELYAWMSASGMVPMFSRKVCLQCAPYSARPDYRDDIFGPKTLDRPVVIVADDECAELMCTTKKAKSLLGAE